MRFKVGDRVKVIDNSGAASRLVLGSIWTITGVGSPNMVYINHPSDGDWYEYRFELVNNKEDKMLKHYKVLKDTPQWFAGAILKELDGGGYEAINDLWDTDAHDYKKDEDNTYYESGFIVENSPDWYQRVYQVKALGAAKYLTKEAARKFHTDSTVKKPNRG